MIMSSSQEKPQEKSDQEAFSVSVSEGFNRWLAEAGGSISFSTYQVGKFFFIGLNPQQQLSIFERTFPRSMGIGLSADNRPILLATRSQIYAFDDLLKPEQKSNDYDALYAPHVSWITGDIDIHDIAYDANKQPLFVSTLFNCIGTVAPGFSFKPVWRPPFISSYVAEDRCHLNGMAIQDGKPKYVTCVSTSDTKDGWRDHRADGGMVINVETNEVCLEGLSMRHSPRLHNGRLWLLNSGRGEFGWVNLEKRSFNPVTFCPGFARGLYFVGKYALIGLSEPREGKTFDGVTTARQNERKRHYCALRTYRCRYGNR